MRTLFFALLVGSLLGFTSHSQAEYVRFLYQQGINNPKANPDPKVKPGVPGLPGAPEVKADDKAASAIPTFVIVEGKLSPNRQLGTYVLEHRWGRTNLAPTNDVRFQVLMKDEKSPILWTTLEKYKELKKQMPDNPPADQIPVLQAKFALTHGLWNESNLSLNELLGLRTHPLQSAWQHATNAMSREFGGGRDAADIWKERFPNATVRKSQFFTIVTTASSPNSPWFDERMRQLDSCVRMYAVWATLKEFSINSHKSKLVVIAPGKLDEYLEMVKEFEPVTQHLDGFFAPADNVLVLSPVPLDPGIANLSRSFQQATAQGWNIDSLLKGEMRQGVHPLVNCQMQTTALLVKAVTDQSEWHTISNLGMTQVAASFGIIPAKVRVPLWLQSGVGSYFETPLGAPWQGFGGVNFNYIVAFKLMEESRDADKLDKPEEMLRAILTDAAFVGSKGDPIAQLRARTLAWSLVYFMFENKLAGKDGTWRRYLDSLGDMPREVEIDSQTHFAHFLQAFKLEDPEFPNRPHPTKFKAFANDWLRFVSNTGSELELADILNQARKDKEWRAKPPAPKTP